MEDPVLNRQLDESRELHQRWGQFREFVVKASRAKKITPEAEVRFLEMKSYIAMLHDSFMAGLKHDHKTGQNIMTILQDCILLRRVADYSESERQKFEFDWNECLLLMTEQIAELEEEQNRLANIKESTYKWGKRKEKFIGSIHGFFTSLGFKVALAAIAIAFVLFGLPALGVFQYSMLRDNAFTRPVYSFVAGYMYRPLINEELPFGSFADVGEVEDNDVKLERSARPPLVNGNLNNDQMRQEVLAGRLGMDEEQVNQAMNLLGGSSRQVKTVSQAPDSLILYMLFDTSSKAEQFTELVVNAVRGLPDNRGNAILRQAYMARSANFVALTFFPAQPWAEYLPAKWRYARDMDLDLLE